MVCLFVCPCPCTLLCLCVRARARYSKTIAPIFKLHFKDDMGSECGLQNLLKDFTPLRDTEKYVIKVGQTCVIMKLRYDDSITSFEDGGGPQKLDSVLS